MKKNHSKILHSVLENAKKKAEEFLNSCTIPTSWDEKEISWLIADICYEMFQEVLDKEEKHLYNMFMINNKGD